MNERGISQTPVEDIWEHGHAMSQVTDERERFFWPYQLVKEHPETPFFVFNPAARPSLFPNHKLEFDWHSLDDWVLYRATPAMLREGIALLDQYLYASMQGSGSSRRLPTDQELELLLRIFDNWGGIFGLYPTMRPFIPEPSRQALIRVYGQRAIPKLWYFDPEVRDPYYDGKTLDLKRLEAFYQSLPQVLQDAVKGRWK